MRVYDRWHSIPLPGVARGSNCSAGFPTPDELAASAALPGAGDCSSSDVCARYRELRLIPGAAFSCGGQLTAWLLAGEPQAAGELPQAQLWRRNGSSTYRLVAAFPINISEASASNSSRVYRWPLPEPVLVREGDALGLLHRRRRSFGLFYKEGEGPLNFLLPDLDAMSADTASLNASTHALPLISPVLAAGTDQATPTLLATPTLPATPSSAHSRKFTILGLFVAILGLAVITATVSIVAITVVWCMRMRGREKFSSAATIQLSCRMTGGAVQSDLTGGAVQSEHIKCVTGEDGHPGMQGSSSTEASVAHHSLNSGSSHLHEATTAQPVMSFNNPGPMLRSLNNPGSTQREGTRDSQFKEEEGEEEENEYVVRQLEQGPVEEENEYVVHQLIYEEGEGPVEEENEYVVHQLVYEERKGEGPVEEENEYVVRQLIYEEGEGPLEEDENKYIVRQLVYEERKGEGHYEEVGTPENSYLRILAGAGEEEPKYAEAAVLTGPEDMLYSSIGPGAGLELARLDGVCHVYEDMADREPSSQQ